MGALAEGYSLLSGGFLARIGCRGAVESASGWRGFEHQSRGRIDLDELFKNSRPSPYSHRQPLTMMCSTDLKTKS